MEAAVTLAMVLRKFDLSLDIKPEDVGIYTGATIHTRNGLMMKAKKRVPTKAVPARPTEADDVNMNVAKVVEETSMSTPTSTSTSERISA